MLVDSDEVLPTLELPLPPTGIATSTTIDNSQNECNIRLDSNGA